MNKYFILYIFLFSPFLSCDSNTYKGNPQLFFYIEDSPKNEITDFFTSIDSVAIFDSISSQWVELKPDSRKMNLIFLTGGELQEIVAQDVPQGEYTKFKFILNKENTAFVINRVSIQPNINDSDLIQEFPIRFSAKENIQHTIIADIDIASSLVNPQDNNYDFVPSVSIVDLNTWGVFRGLLVDKDSIPITTQMLLTATNNAGYEKSSYTNYRTADVFIRLPEGIYSITLFSSDVTKWSNVTIEDSIKIEAGVPTNIGVIPVESLGEEIIE